MLRTWMAQHGDQVVASVVAGGALFLGFLERVDTWASLGLGGIAMAWLILKLIPKMQERMDKTEERMRQMQQEALSSVRDMHRETMGKVEKILSDSLTAVAEMTDAERQERWKLIERWTGERAPHE